MSSSAPRHEYFTFDGPPVGDPAAWPAILGGKGAGLARMRALSLPVPPGFTMPTSASLRVVDEGWSAAIGDAVAAGLAELESATGRRLGGGDDPLLVSVRSGAPVSMPGMMDTVLNVGMTPDAAEALGRSTGDDRFGADTYRRFVESYVTVVGGGPAELVASTLSSVAGPGAVGLSRVEVVERWRTALADEGFPIPTDPLTQTAEAVQAVFRSWGSDRAAVYRDREGIPADLGTAATVQTMVFGNRGDRSGTGVAFTRDPSTGEPGLMGDFLARAQGEDVVAGTHRTEPLDALATRWPDIGDELVTMAEILEHEYRDMVDLEFTVEAGTLWLLQARVGKRSPRAALRIAVDQAEDAAFPLDRAAAVARVAELLDDPPTDTSGQPERGGGAGGGPETEPDVEVLADGLAASPGRAVGAVCIDPDDAVDQQAAGVDVVLVRPETSPADVHGMVAARGLVTALGGLVSHAAVVARSWGIPAVVGATALGFDDDGLLIDDRSTPVGTIVTVDGDGGRLLLGAHPAAGRELPEVAVLRRWHGDLAVITDGGPGSPVAGGEGLTDEVCLRALALKGMATADAVAGFALRPPDAASAVLDRLAEGGLASSAPGDRFMLTPDGTAAVDAAYIAEVETAAAAVEAQLDRFHELNQRFKEVVTAWQMRTVDGEQVINDHADADYDAGVLGALTGEIHDGIIEVIQAIGATVGRLLVYEQRLQVAVDAIAGGDVQMVAHPLRDSYHTVWFELHEELIRLSGRNRADEAAAGRA